MFENLFQLIPVILVVAIVVGGVAFAFGYFYKEYRVKEAIKAAEISTSKLLADAQAEHRELLLEAKDEAIRLRAAAEAEVRDRRADLLRQERRIQQKEEGLDRKTEALERRERAIGQREKEVEATKHEAENLRRQQVSELERISGLTILDARNELLKAIEDEARQDANRRVREVEAAAKEEGERRARRIISA